MFFERKTTNGEIIFLPNRRLGLFVYGVLLLAVIGGFFLMILYENWWFIFIPLLVFIFFPGFIYRIDRLSEIHRLFEMDPEILEWLMPHSSRISNTIVKSLLTGKPISIPLTSSSHSARSA